jgi:phosphoribosyl 1,2-cyclic phosphodiesterase
MVQGDSIDQISAVFITHEHFNHKQELRGLSKYKHKKS